jgi:hypothetical protein
MQRRFRMNKAQGADWVVRQLILKQVLSGKASKKLTFAQSIGVPVW